ncbi:hypothetical protein [Streptomyces aureocirculatus]|uniref:hypothetical protein n=1 Tax=Streptomyces aureocirculatus TaxID=67275 RepID=UPI0005625E24|nr:hypothetical protein [Streptomyces aureocirculatus]
MHSTTSVTPTPTPTTTASAAPAPVQRSVTPARPARLRSVTPVGTAAAVPSPLRVARLVTPSVTSAAHPVQRLPLAPTGGGGTRTGAEHTVQRGLRSAARSATGALAANAAATVANTLERFRTGSQGQQGQQNQQPQQGQQNQQEDFDDPLPFPPDRNPAPVTSASSTPPPGYTRVPAGTFDPKALTDFQVDELVHRMIGRITRLVRTELRMDRERTGRLRDDRR